MQLLYYAYNQMSIFFRYVWYFFRSICCVRRLVLPSSVLHTMIVYVHCTSFSLRACVCVCGWWVFLLFGRVWDGVRERNLEAYQVICSTHKINEFTITYVDSKGIAMLVFTWKCIGCQEGERTIWNGQKKKREALASHSNTSGSRNSSSSSNTNKRTHVHMHTHYTQRARQLTHSLVHRYWHRHLQAGLYDRNISLHVFPIYSFFILISSSSSCCSSSLQWQANFRNSEFTFWNSSTVKIDRSASAPYRQCMHQLKISVKKC